MSTKISNAVHNLFIHPLAGLAWLFGFEKLGDWIHGDLPQPTAEVTVSGDGLNSRKRQDELYAECIARLVGVHKSDEYSVQWELVLKVRDKLMAANDQAHARYGDLAMQSVAQLKAIELLTDEFEWKVSELDAMEELLKEYGELTYTTDAAVEVLKQKLAEAGMTDAEKKAWENRQEEAADRVIEVLDTATQTVRLKVSAARSFFG
jgi:hypothetical protein